jgi:hypothetical protein
MANPRSGKRSSEEYKSVREMGSEPPSSLGYILEICLVDQSDNKIVNGCHDFAGIANGHASSILFESHISSVMQTCFNPPMIAAKT